MAQKDKKMQIGHTSKTDVEVMIRTCQKNNHVQQVAFSTYHHALTQICFTCNKIRTSLDEVDLL